MDVDGFVAVHWNRHGFPLVSEFRVLRLRMRGPRRPMREELGRFELFTDCDLLWAFWIHLQLAGVIVEGAEVIEVVVVWMFEDVSLGVVYFVHEHAYGLSDGLREEGTHEGVGGSVFDAKGLDNHCSNLRKSDLVFALATSSCTASLAGV